MFALLPAVGSTELLLLVLTTVVMALPAWRICVKAGFPGPLGLLILVPFLNLGLLFFLAYAEWPALRGKGGRGGLD